MKIRVETKKYPGFFFFFFVCLGVKMFCNVSFTNQELE